MRLTRPVLTLFALLLPACLAADVIVLADGRVFEVQGPIRIQGDHVLFKMKSSGQDAMFRRFEVDMNKTRSLNQVLESEVHGLPRLRRVESIEAQGPERSRRSVPYQESLEPMEEEEVQDMARTRVPVRYPKGDYPITVQPRRISHTQVGEEQAEDMYREGRQPRERKMTDYEDYRSARQIQEEQEAARDRMQRERDEARARREAEEAAAEAERQRMRADREAEREAAKAERERMKEEEAAAREAERAAREQERLDAKADRYRSRIAEVDTELDAAKAELKRLTDLQQEAQQQFEGERLPSVDREIDRILSDIEKLEARRSRYQDRLDEVLAE